MTHANHNESINELSGWHNTSAVPLTIHRCTPPFLFRRASYAIKQKVLIHEYNSPFFKVLQKDFTKTSQKLVHQSVKYVHQALHSAATGSLSLGSCLGEYMIMAGGDVVHIVQTLVCRNRRSLAWPTGGILVIPGAVFLQGTLCLGCDRWSLSHFPVLWWWENAKTLCAFHKICRIRPFGFGWKQA